MQVLLIVVAVMLLALFILFLFPRITIAGESMYPTLKDGDVYSGSRFHKLEIGQIYVLKNPEYDPEHKYVVKRLVSATDDFELLYFLGDNPPESHDSRAYGYVPRSFVVAKLIKKWR